MIDIKMVFIITTLTGGVFLVTSIIASMINRKRFNEICILYKEKYGSLPDAVVLFENINSLYYKGAYGIKTQFIFMPLLWNKSSILTKNDDKDFIRGLPKQIIRPFYVEAFLGLISIVFFIIAGLLMLAMKHGWV
jgi:hypothetical protein